MIADQDGETGASGYFVEGNCGVEQVAKSQRRKHQAVGREDVFDRRRTA
jgi:hypothetical protein